ncbi:TetR/AcrR family transcriptional regulator [Janibacter alkaliphilus]|nr:TetR/AcrR family transcriptional regulator [Janibacter alkaliphilus]
MAPVSQVRRARMTGQQRREQLVAVGRSLFAEKGVDGTSVEEIAATAGVSKPVVYEHFGGKEGLYAVVVDREIQALTTAITDALMSDGSSRELIERAAMALLDYIEHSTDGFRILVRDSPHPGSAAPTEDATETTPAGGTYASLLSDVAAQVEHLLSAELGRRGFPARTSPLYAQMLVGMVSLTGQWWLDSRGMPREEVAAHLVNLAWNGLTGLQPDPELTDARGGGEQAG